MPLTLSGVTMEKEFNKKVEGNDINFREKEKYNLVRTEYQ